MGDPAGEGIATDVATRGRCARRARLCRRRRRRRRRVDVVEHGFRSYRREEGVDERGVRRTIGELVATFTRGCRCKAHGNVAPSSSQPPDKSQPSSSSDANSLSPSARGYFEYFSEGSQAGCAAVGDFPRELRAEAVGEKVALGLARLRAGGTRGAKLPDGPLARMHLIATSGKSFECLALPSTSEAAPVGGATAVQNRIKPVRVPCRNRPV